MENANLNNTLKTDICVILEDSTYDVHRDRIWSDGAEEFLRKIHKQGLHLTIIGPRIPYKLGSKKNVRFLDRHDVIGMKELEITKKQKIELRVLSKKSRSWFRVRTEICLVIGTNGIWPTKFDGWTTGGVLTHDAFLKWAYEHEMLPSDRIAFLGSHNKIFRSAIKALKMNAARTFIIEPEARTKCFRSYEDMYESIGGRVLRNHQIQKLELDPTTGMKRIFLKNEKGTMILEVGSLVLGQSNDEHINAPKYWKRGLFYVQRRIHPLDNESDEEVWQDIYDWEEIYWRVSRKLGITDQKKLDSALTHLKQLKRSSYKYRTEKTALEYSGKVLSRNSLSTIQTSVSTPRDMKKAHPIASLECFESSPCRACADACPESAIEIKALIDQPKVIENLCTGCGACVAACPTSAALMLQETKTVGKAKYVFADPLNRPFQPNSNVQMLSRKGDVLGVGKLIHVQSYENAKNNLITVEATDVFLWDARRISYPQQSERHQEIFKKFCWVTLNGVRRMSPVNIPVSIVLWKLGQQRFEDAMLCSNGICGLCDIEINGKNAFACQEIVSDGMNIKFEINISKYEKLNPVCVCRQVEAKELMGATLEGVSPECMLEKTGLGSGACHGRWCRQSIELAVDSEKLRPTFHGFDQSPWRDLRLKDIFEEKKYSKN